MKHKVMIVDDHFVVREGLRLILETNEKFEVVGEAENGKVALRLIKEQNPDVILMDLNMPVMSGLDTMKVLIEEYIDTPIIILTTYNEDELMVQGIELGAKGYLLKDTNRDQLFNTIESAIRGETLLSAKIMEKVLNLKNKGINKSENLLTEKELLILKSVAHGYRNKDIASDMGIAERTVKAHLTTIYNKLGVNSRSEAVALVLDRGFIQL